MPVPSKYVLSTWTKELVRHQSLNVVYTGVLVWDGVAILWVPNLIRNEGVKLLHPPSPFQQPHTVCIYCIYFGKGGGGAGQREDRGETVHKKGKKY